MSYFNNLFNDCDQIYDDESEEFISNFYGGGGAQNLNQKQTKFGSDYEINQQSQNHAHQNNQNRIFEQQYSQYNIFDDSFNEENENQQQFNQMFGIQSTPHHEHRVDNQNLTGIQQNIISNEQKYSVNSFNSGISTNQDLAVSENENDDQQINLRQEDDYATNQMQLENLKKIPNISVIQIPKIPNQANETNNPEKKIEKMNDGDDDDNYNINVQEPILNDFNNSQVSFDNTFCQKQTPANNIQVFQKINSKKLQNQNDEEKQQQQNINKVNNNDSDDENSKYKHKINLLSVNKITKTFEINTEKKCQKIIENIGQNEQNSTPNFIKQEKKIFQCQQPPNIQSKQQLDVQKLKTGNSLLSITSPLETKNNNNNKIQEVKNNFSFQASKKLQPKIEYSFNLDLKNLQDKIQVNPQTIVSRPIQSTSENNQKMNSPAEDICNSSEIKQELQLEINDQKKNKINVKKFLFPGKQNISSIQDSTKIPLHIDIITKNQKEISENSKPLGNNVDNNIQNQNGSIQLDLQERQKEENKKKQTSFEDQKKVSLVFNFKNPFKQNEHSLEKYNTNVSNIESKSDLSPVNKQDYHIQH